MRIIILGGAGFIGKQLAKALLAKGTLALGEQPAQKINQVILFDKVEASDLPTDDRLEIHAGDICDEGEMTQLFNQPIDLVFHLAAIVSGEAEKDFELGMAVNLQATMQLLELCRKQQQCPIFVFASSCAVFGGDLSEKIYDFTAARPQSSYGTQKAMAGLLINDYSRRGFVDGRILRLPTIAIRPGKANAATSSFVSGIIREPLNGEKAQCPVAGDTMVWILSPDAVIHNFIHAATLSGEKMGLSRIINLPGIRTSVNAMVESLEALAGKETTALIDWTPDPFIQSIVLTWPTDFETTYADQLGFIKDASVATIIEQYYNR